MLTIDEAQQRLKSLIHPIEAVESINTANALGRIAAESISAPISLPQWPLSAMDGYAIRFRDLKKTTRFNVVDTALAGHPSSNTLKANEAMRITTGGVLPQGADWIIIQENVDFDAAAKRIQIKPALGDDIAKQNYIRPVGEDIREQSVVFNKGHQFKSADLGVLTALGINQINVFRQPNILLVSTGDELRSLGETLDRGQIYDSNRAMLLGIFDQMGLPVKTSINLADDADSLYRAFDQATENQPPSADIIITTGGVSVGDADYIKPVLERLGELHIWRIAIKPGKPFTFGKIRQSLFFGLPGNPVSAAVTFYQLLLPAIQHYMNRQPRSKLLLKAQCLDTLKKNSGRAEFQRGIFHQDEHGELIVRSTGNQSSGALSSMSSANCFIHLSQSQSDVAVGETVLIEPFSSLFD